MSRTVPPPLVLRARKSSESSLRDPPSPSPLRLMHAVPRVHTRGDSGGGLTVSNSATRTAQPSPSKSNRTYDAKQLTQQMQRLGQSHLSPGLPHSLNSSASASVLSLPASASGPSAATPQDSNAWGSLHMYVLPLFNGDALRLPM